jgi:hypothetical protein
MKVSGRLHSPEKRAPFCFTNFIRGWVFLRADVDAMKKRKSLAPAENGTPIPQLSSPYPTLYRLNDDSYNYKVHRSRRCSGAILFRSFPSTCHAWVILPGAYSSASMILRLIRAHTPPHHVEMAAQKEGSYILHNPVQRA